MRRRRCAIRICSQLGFEFRPVKCFFKLLSRFPNCIVDKYTTTAYTTMQLCGNESWLLFEVSRTYVIKLDPQNKIVPRENERFKDANGKPLKRYEVKITHVNNGKEQLWDTSKTVCLQIIGELRKGFTTLKLTRNGSDRNTTYTIEGVQ
jgi:hypothetical protein